MSPRDQWEIFYRLYVDGEETEVVLVGSSKSDAYKNSFERQWEIVYPDKPVPKKRRCKLEEEERWRL